MGLLCAFGGALHEEQQRELDSVTLNWESIKLPRTAPLRLYHPECDREKFSPPVVGRVIAFTRARVEVKATDERW
jgi:hypothetical protein